MSKTEGLMVVGVGAVTAVALLSLRKGKRRRKPSAATPVPPASPFVPGSHCTVLADAAATDRWLKTKVVPEVLPRLEAFAVPHHLHQEARRAVRQLVDAVFGATVPECPVVQTRAARQVWKALWCDVVAQLVVHGKLDEELDDVLRLCLDPSFDPWVDTQDSAEAFVEPTPSKGPSPLVGPLPLPVPIPTGPDGEGLPATPPNLWVASTRQELSEIGVMRMMEGTSGGAPIKGPSAHLVMFAASPFWPGLEQARADMTRFAARHPGLSFVEVSFVDTQRHFGKPKDLGGIVWALTATGPDGRVFPSPIVRDDPRDAPPSAELWAKVIAHASGFVGARSVQRIARPRRFGDLIRAMAARRAHAPVAARSRPQKPRPSPRQARRRRGG